MSYGIDYSNGQSNVDTETGIHFGVVPQNDVLQSWADSSEGDYGEPHCPKCGNEARAIDDEAIPDLDTAEDWEDNGRDFACPTCRYSFNSDEAYGDEALAFTLDDGEYKAQQTGDDGDIFIVKSPYFTHAQYCSPCAPGACHLRNPVDRKGPRAYCFAPDWFDWFAECGTEPAGEYEGRKTSCPYPVYRVSDGACIYRPYPDSLDQLRALLRSEQDSAGERLRCLDTFTRAYVTCALWAETDNATPSGGEPLDTNYDIGDIDPEALLAMAEDCQRFQDENRGTIDKATDTGYTEESAGNDLWLTRNRHGAGYWDRGLGDIGQALTDAAHSYGSAYLYLGDDGTIYQG